MSTWLGDRRRLLGVKPKNTRDNADPSLLRREACRLRRWTNSRAVSARTMSAAFTYQVVPKPTSNAGASTQAAL